MNHNIPCTQMIYKRVRTTNTVKVDCVKRIGRLVVVRKGVSDVHINCISKVYIRDYDCSQLWIDVQVASLGRN